MWEEVTGGCRKLHNQENQELCDSYFSAFGISLSVQGGRDDRQDMWWVWGRIQMQTAF